MRRIIPVLMIGTIAALLLTACGVEFPSEDKTRGICAPDAITKVKRHSTSDWAGYWEFTCTDGTLRFIKD